MPTANHHRQLPILLLVASSCIGWSVSPAVAEEPQEHALVRGDRDAEAIVHYLLDLHGSAAMKIVSKRRTTDGVTGETYTLMKVRVDGKTLTATANERTGTVALGRQLPRQERKRLLASLPYVYSKMRPHLLRVIREAQGGVLGGQAAVDAMLEVTFYAESVQGLDAIAAALGDAEFTRYDVPKMFETNPPVSRPSKDGSPTELPAAPDIRAVFTRLPLSEVLNVGAIDWVVGIERTLISSPALDVSVPHIKGDVAQGYVGGLPGYDADIAVVDTGIDRLHPNLPYVTLWQTFIGGTADDTEGHGTHVAGIAGNNHATFGGMAPWADLINAKAVPGNVAETSAAFVFARKADVVNCSFGLAPQCYWPLTSEGRVCLTNAECDSGPGVNDGLCDLWVSDGNSGFATAADHEVYTRNIHYAVAAGNEGPRAVPATPADAFNVITVGSSNLGGPPVVSDFSNRGPTGSKELFGLGRCKPDVIAPGEGQGGGPPADAIDSTAWNHEDAHRPDIIDRTGLCSNTTGDLCTNDDICFQQCDGGTKDGAACVDVPGDTDCTGVVDGDCVVAGQCDTTALYNGTSMATPHVSGLIAMLIDWGEDHWRLTDTPYIKATIINNCRRLAGWTRPDDELPLDFAQGAGEIDAKEAYHAYADDLRVWQQLLDDNTEDGKSHWYWIDVTEASPASPKTVVVTLVFERHTKNAAPAAVDIEDINDVDLRLHLPDLSDVVQESVGDENSVEHIVVEVTENGRYCIEVDPIDLTQDDRELYAVACNYRLHFTGTTCPCIADYGDATDGLVYGGGSSVTYPTLKANNGARHLDWTKEWLGSSRPPINGERQKDSGFTVRSTVDPFPSVSGENDADDSADQDGFVNLIDQDKWDDGVRMGDLKPGVSSHVEVTVQTTVDETGFGPNGRYQDTPAKDKLLYINAWCDWNGNGSWTDSGEKIIGTDSPNGQATVDPTYFGYNSIYTIGETFTDSNGSGVWEHGEPFVDQAGVTERTYVYGVTPPAQLADSFWCRFRLDYGENAGKLSGHSPGLSGPTGPARFGEVEDYYHATVPAVSEWGLAALAILLLAGAKIHFGRRRRTKSTAA